MNNKNTLHEVSLIFARELLMVESSNLGYHAVSDFFGNELKYNF